LVGSILKAFAAICQLLKNQLFMRRLAFPRAVKFKADARQNDKPAEAGREQADVQYRD
jgi:hypothetical protein